MLQLNMWTNQRFSMCISVVLNGVTVSQIQLEGNLRLLLDLRLHPFTEHLTLHVDFCSAGYMGLSWKLQLVQNTVAQTAMSVPWYAHVTPLLLKLYWLPMSFWVQFNFLGVSYKALCEIGPVYLRERVSPFISAHSVRSDFFPYFFNQK